MAKWMDLSAEGLALPDRTLDEAQQDLVDHNRGLAPFLAGGYRAEAEDAGIRFEDLVSEAYVGLCCGASRFDVDLVDIVLRKDDDGNDESDDVQINRQFCSYVGKWITGAILRAIARAMALPPLLIDPDAIVDVPEEETLSDRGTQLIWDAIDELPRSDKAILLRKFGLGGYRRLTLIAIQKKLAISPKLVRKSLLRSFESIAAHMRKAQ